MSRFFESGVLVLTPEDARMLYQGVKIGELRARSRVGNTAFYALLVDISRAAFSVPAAVSGIEQRQDAASHETGFWTVQRLARAVGLADRTVRNDCESGTLPATKPGRAWLIPAGEAKTYIDRRRK